MIPALTAEEDRDLVRRHYADLAREKELMGSNAAVYHSDRSVITSSIVTSTLYWFTVDTMDSLRLKSDTSICLSTWLTI